jgi:hypothetical protein
MKSILKTIGEKLIAMADVNVNPAPIPVPTGNTSGATSGATAPVAPPAMIVSEIQPKKISVAYSVAGAPVTITGADGQSVIAEDGDYPLINNKTITITQGKLTNVVDVIPSGTTAPAPSGATSGATKNEVPPQFAKMAIETENINLTDEQTTAEKIDELIQMYETKLTNTENKYKKLIEALKTGGNTTMVEAPNTNKHLTKAEIIKLSLAEKRKNNNY